MLTCKKKRHLDTVDVFEELTLLLEKVDYASPSSRREQLNRYFNSLEKGLSGKIVSINTEELADSLREKGQWLLNQVRTCEWLQTFYSAPPRMNRLKAPIVQQAASSKIPVHRDTV